MDINLLFKIAAIGILVAVLHQVLVRAGREDQARGRTAQMSQGEPAPGAQ